MLHDVRFAIRGIFRSAAFSILVVATIGLALGLNTALFTIFDAYVLRPFAVTDPYSLYTVTWLAKSGRRPMTLREFDQLREQSIVASGAFATEVVMAAIQGQPLVGQRVTADYFHLLDAAAAVGRPLLPEDVVGPQTVVVLSDGAWKAKFAADPSIVGKSFAMLGKSYTVVGIARAGFEGVSRFPPDFWIPLADDHPVSNLSVVVRLKPETTEAQARAEMNVIAERLTASGPPEHRAIAARLDSSATMMTMNSGALAIFTPAFCAFGLVLVIACANVANMMLARSAARHKEIAVRLALGASRARIVRQLVIESMMLASPAAIVGFFIARLTISTAQRLYFSTMPRFMGRLVRLLPLEPDARVFFFVLAAAIVATIGFALPPALQATSHNVAGYRPSRLRNALVISQVTVCALLLICAGILLRGSESLDRHDPGLAARNILSVDLQPGAQEKLLDRLRAAPSIDMLAVAAWTPLTGSRSIPVAVAQNAPLVRSGFNIVSSDYFELFQIPILRGRGFTRDESGVALISEATARQFWPGRDPLGQMIRIEPDPRIDRGRIPEIRVAQIIGIVRDVTSGQISDGRDPSMFYFPASSRSALSGTLLVRLKSSSEADRRALGDLLDRIAPGGARISYSMDELIELQIFPFRVSFVIAGFLGGLSLVLTCSGVYGVLSYLVTQRTKEIGIRIALGASNGAVVRLVMTQVSRLAICGAATGGLLALGVSRIFASLIEEINTYEPRAYVVGIVLVLIASFIASLVPSRRAAQVDPLVALRND